MQTSELIYRGSVKDIYKSDSDILFKFSDRYSIFDWGEMPDKIKNKGNSLAKMGSLFFEYLNNHNIATHYLDHHENTLKVKKIHVPYKDPDSYYNFESYSCLIPLEVIFRFKIYNIERFEGKKQRPEFKDISFEKDQFNEPIIEFSTKLEASDRYIDYVEAKKIASLKEQELNLLITLSKKIACHLKELFSKAQLDLIDGKLEFGFDQNRNIFLVDTIGLDELRIEKNSILLSKEFLRDFYKSTNWFNKLEVYKETSPKNWKTKMTEAQFTPSVLPREVLEQAQNLYLAFTNTLSSLIENKDTRDQYKIDNYFEQYYKGQI